MIVDSHTHVFPPAAIERRERLIQTDPTFAELYSSPKAALATAEELLASMDRARIDVSVMLGFAWRDADVCYEHNDYMIEAVARSNGRLVAFCTLPLASGIEAIEAEMRRCVAAGARGFGELRPENVGFELGSDAGERLAEVARELNVPLLFHVSEPVGHSYAGKEGLSMRTFYDFACEHPETTLIGAHWAGGLPFYALMPEVRALPNIVVDTAATSLLYTPSIYSSVASMVGPECILFGSDYPLLTQSRSRLRIEQARLDVRARELILGGNASALLGLA
ncbi:MAG TPA: amidohydrolase family protein [Dehalococcoidia bacterium]|nr:amidohydrolase family protein [Dehalococcoidia bacterium]